MKMVTLFTIDRQNYYFIVRPIAWGDREVGDDLTNPVPSFVSERKWEMPREEDVYAAPTGWCL